MSSPYLSREETDALLAAPRQPESPREAALAAEIEQAWAEMPDDLREWRFEQGFTLAGAVHALVEAARIARAQADPTGAPSVRLYHVHITNDATRATIRMTAYPVAHAEACTIMSKIRKGAGRRVHLVEVQKGGAA